MNKLVIIILLLIALFSCKNKIEENPGFEIKGEIFDAEEGEVIMLQRNPETWAMDTITMSTVSEGKFILKGEIESPSTCYLRFVVNVTYKDNEGNMQQTKIACTDQILVDNVLMHYESWVRDFNTRKMWGNELHTKVYQLIQENPELNKKWRSYQSCGGYLKAKYFEGISKEKQTQLTNERNSLYHKYEEERNIVISSILENDSSFLYKGLLLQAYGINNTQEAYAESIIQELTQHYGEENYLSNILRGILKAAEIKNKTTIGSQYIDVKANDLDGNTLKLSEVVGEGKYVLLDFWASWCNPCLAEFPFLKKDYAKFKTKGFEIFAISIDKKKDAWIKVSKDEEINWINTLVIKDDNAQNAYSVGAIPANFLIGPDGKIIAKNLRREKLEEKLNELFSN